MDIREMKTSILTVQQIDDLLHKNKNKLVVGLSKQIGFLVEGYESFQKKTGKGNLKFIYISFLRSSILDQFPFYRIDFYDKQQFCDLVEYCGYWSIAEVSDVIYINHPKITKGILWMDEEWEQSLESIWAEEAEMIHTQLIQIFPDIAEGVVEFSHYLSGVSLFFGELLDKVEYEKLVT